MRPVYKDEMKKYFDIELDFEQKYLNAPVAYEYEFGAREKYPDTWKKEAKKAHPFLYYLIYKPILVYRFVSGIFYTSSRWVKYTLHPQNVIKLKGLSKYPQFTDDILLHTIFKYVEEVDTQLEYLESVREEILELKTWWEQYKDSACVVQENFTTSKIEEMMIRAIKLRDYL